LFEMSRLTHADAYSRDGVACRLAAATRAMFTQAGLKATVGVEIRRMEAPGGRSAF
jgi:hypothetical protein